MKQKIFLAITIFSLLSFKSFDCKINQDLVGIWVYSNYEKNNEIIYNKRNKFHNDRPGIKFNKEGKLIIRQNVGWCGTPPITYRNYEGTWEQTSDSTLIIKYKYWGGIAEEDWLIMNKSKENLKIKMLDYRTERKK